MKRVRAASAVAPNPSTHARRSWAFTLLEILLALGLSALLLLAVSSAISLHLRAFDIGRTDVEQAQLARALVRRLSDDLRSCVAPPPRREPPPALPSRTAGVDAAPVTTAAPVNWFSGDSRQLALIVRRGNLAQTSEKASGSPEESIEYWAGLVQVELALLGTEESSSSAVESEESTSGLVRRARVWLPGLETGSTTDPADSALTSSTDEWPGTSSPPAGSPLEQPDSPTSGSGDLSQPADLTEIVVPEVVDLALRYFDGRAWHTTWSANPDTGLPRAVEIRLALASPAEAAELRRQGPLFEEPLWEESSTISQDSLSEHEVGTAIDGKTAIRSTLEVFRDVVWLPQGRAQASQQDHSDLESGFPPPTDSARPPSSPLPPLMGARPLAEDRPGGRSP